MMISFRLSFELLGHPVQLVKLQELKEVHIRYHLQAAPGLGAHHSQGNDALEKLLQETHRTHCRLGNFPPQARHQEVGVEECHPSENLAAASHPSDPLGDVLSCCDVKELQGWG